MYEPREFSRRHCDAGFIPEISWKLFLTSASAGRFGHPVSVGSQALAAGAESLSERAELTAAARCSMRLTLA
jgi:hypothetical protein